MKLKNILQFILPLNSTPKTAAYSAITTNQPLTSVHHFQMQLFFANFTENVKLTKQMYFLFLLDLLPNISNLSPRNRMLEYKMNDKKLSKQTGSCLSNIGTRRTGGADDSIISLLHKQHTFKQNPAKERQPVINSSYHPPVLIHSEFNKVIFNCGKLRSKIGFQLTDLTQTDVPLVEFTPF